MKLKKAILLAFLMGLVFGLAGCGMAPMTGNETLEQRLKNKEYCEEHGGTYKEFKNVYTSEYDGWNCDLSSTKEEN